MKFMLITNDPQVAQYSESCGVDRIFVDMEVLGKDERQGHLDTHKAAHTIDDVRTIRSSVSTAEVMVRVNPLHSGTQNEVDAAIDAGADRLMLPMFKRVDDVGAFAEAVRGRVPVTLLAETPSSLTSLPAWVGLLGAEDQVHFGLNDMSLAMGLSFLFEPLVARMFDHSAAVLAERGIEFGVGGVARVGHGMLPAECVLGEHARLGSSWAILSRAMHGQARDLDELRATLDLEIEIASLRRVVSTWKVASDDELEENHARLTQSVFAITGQTNGGSRA